MTGKIKRREAVISYNVDDFGVLRVYCGRSILFEAQDFLGTPRAEIERFIDENLERGEDDFEILTEERADAIEDAICTRYLDRENYDFIVAVLDKLIVRLKDMKEQTRKLLDEERAREQELDI